LALAVGILVDDSSGDIENTHRLLSEEGMPLPEATLHGAAGLPSDPGFNLAISCVFTSVIFLEGPAKYLFTRSARGRLCDARSTAFRGH